MKKLFLATAALLCLLAVAVPLAALAVALPSPVPAATAPPLGLDLMALLSLLLLAVKWCVNHWAELSALLASGVALYQAIRARQWDTLVVRAGEVTYQLSKVLEASQGGLTDAGRRDQAANTLYEEAGPIARQLFNPADFLRAVESGWKLIAKPKLNAEAGS